MMLILAAVTSWHDLLLAMRRLGVPRVLVATLQLMERYIHVLGEELDRMRTARRARSFHPRSDWSWTLLTSMVSVLLLRSLERSERVHAAMIARGWDGTMRSLDENARQPSMTTTAVIRMRPMTSFTRGSGARAGVFATPMARRRCAA